jgi:hypothetical protein
VTLLLHALAAFAAAAVVLPAVFLLAARPKPDAVLEVSPPCCGGPATRDHVHRHAAGCPYAQAA